MGQGGCVERGNVIWFGSEAVVRGFAGKLSDLRAGVSRVRADALAGGDGGGDGGGGGFPGEPIFQETDGVSVERVDHWLWAGAAAGLWIECLAAAFAAAAGDRIEASFHGGWEACLQSGLVRSDRGDAAGRWADLAGSQLTSGAGHGRWRCFSGGWRWWCSSEKSGAAG